VLDFHLFLQQGNPDMKRKRYFVEPIISIPRQHEAGRSMIELPGREFSE
jgi:hypothetical protein